MTKRKECDIASDMTHILFIHGVPDTPHVWGPLISSLGLKPADYSAPALPGFGSPRPDGFAATKDAYADWLISEMEAAANNSAGPIHIFGHDWGALLTLRACALRPDLVASWAVSNAVIDSEYRGHRMARLWATPLVGEFVMLGLRNPERMATALAEAGMPAEMATHEAAHIDKTMRQCILKLYRSARGLRFSGDWESELTNLPKRGKLIWGENDPYVDLSVAQRFSDRWMFPLHMVRGAGHWAIAERPAEVAAQLEGLWRYP